MPPRVDTTGFAYFGVGGLGPERSYGTDFVVRYGVSRSDSARLVAFDSLDIGQPRRGLRTADSPSFEDEVFVQSVEELPMQPEVVWAIGPGGNAWLANTSDYRLHQVTLAGDTLRTVELRRDPIRLKVSERDSLAEASGFDLDEIPVFRPLFDRMDVAPDGSLWVRRPPPGVAWDVFDLCGRYLGAAAPEAKLEREPFVLAAAGILIGVARDELGLEYVVRTVLTDPGGAPVRPADCQGA